MFHSTLLLDAKTELVYFIFSRCETNRF